MDTELNFHCPECGDLDEWGYDDCPHCAECLDEAGESLCIHCHRCSPCHDKQDCKDWYQPKYDFRYEGGE